MARTHRTPPGAPRKPVDVAAMVALYAEGKTTAEVGAAHGVGAATAHRRLLDAGVQMRPAGASRWNERPVDLGALIERLQREPRHQVAHSLRVGIGRIREWLRLAA